jgi:hypothetical protein
MIMLHYFQVFYDMQSDPERCLRVQSQAELAARPDVLPFVVNLF